MTLLIILVAAFGWFIPYYAAKRKSKSSLPSINRAMKLAPFCFMWGYGFHMGIDMWMQDMLGLDGYIRLITEHWSDIPPVVGLCIALFSGWMPVFMIKRYRTHFYYRTGDGQVRNIAEMEKEFESDR